MAAVIANVRANELLYENMEVRMSEHYEIIGRKPSVRGGEAQKVLENATTDKETRYVSQDGMFRLDVEGESTTADQPISEDRIRMFDGRTTRLLEQTRIGNIAQGLVRDPNVIRPHMLLLRKSVAMVALSTFMEGDEALATVPEHPKSANTVMRNT